MSSSNLIRWSGLAALVGGALLVIAEVAEFVFFSGQPASVAAGTGAWIIVQPLYLAVTVLISLGLVGLYAHQAEQAGSLGLIAFLVAFIGTVLVSGLQWSAAFIVPWLARAAPEVAQELLDTEAPGVAAAGYILSFALLALGWLLFGLASLRAEVLPRGAAILLMVGAVLLFLILLLEAPGSGVVFGAALAWVGYALWSGTGEPALTTEAVA